MNDLGSEMKNGDVAEEEIVTAAANEEVTAENAMNKAGVRKLDGMLLHHLAETTLPLPDAKTLRPRDVKSLAGKSLDERICVVATSVPQHLVVTSVLLLPGETIAPLVVKNHGVRPLAEKNLARADLIWIWTWMLIWTATISCLVSTTSN